MKNKANLEPPYSLLFILGSVTGNAPRPDGRHISWTDDGVTVTCLNEADGATTVALIPGRDVVDRGPPVFDREIATPRREVLISTVDLEVVLRSKVTADRTRIRIWDNHPMEPDDIVVGFE